MTGAGHAPVTILLVEDNPADVRLIAEVLGQGPANVELRVVADRDEAMEFLRREGDHRESPRPAAVLLDLNLPGTDGREVLAELKADPALRSIPVVVLTTSRADADVARCYELHANAYVTKPVDLDEFVDAIRSVERFWLETATLPPAGNP